MVEYSCYERNYCSYGIVYANVSDPRNEMRIVIANEEERQAIVCMYGAETRNPQRRPQNDTKNEVRPRVGENS